MTVTGDALSALQGSSERGERDRDRTRADPARVEDRRKLSFVVKERVFEVDHERFVEKDVLGGSGPGEWGSRDGHFSLSKARRRNEAAC